MRTFPGTDPRGADFAGGLPAEPLVGEVAALRTFRVDTTGTLIPLYSHEAWYDGVNTAVCDPPAAHGSGRPHAVPSEDCGCGFYAYGTVEAAARNRQARHVQAVVSCWGGVIAGTQGVRSQYARIDALWMGPHAPAWIRRRVGVRYPSVRVYDDRDLMLAEHPLSELPCYAPRRRRPSVAGVVAAVVGTGVVALGLTPYQALRSSPLLWWAWLAGVLAAVVVTACCVLATRDGKLFVAVGLFVALMGWLAAPMLGLAGWLLRLPLLHGLAVLTGGYLTTLRPRHFPVVEPERDPIALGRRQ